MLTINPTLPMFTGVSSESLLSGIGWYVFALILCPLIIWALRSCGAFNTWRRALATSLITTLVLVILLKLPLIGTLAFLLVAFTIWTYVGVKNATWKRVGIVLLLRLGALGIAFCMVMRPSLAFTELEGVEPTKLLVVFDASESMNASEADGKPTRWQHATKVWTSREVQRRLDRLRREQRIEVVKYLAAEDLRPDDRDAAADGKRTDLGAWLHQLRAKHAHEKHLRGVILFSDGADNGTRFSAQEQARLWRGIAPIHAFGVGDPANPKFRKDLALTSLKVKPDPIFVKSNLTIEAIVQAPGFEKTEVDIVASIEAVGGKSTRPPESRKLVITQEKDQPIVLKSLAPDEPGEYKVTVKITPHADEANKENNEISTFVQVIKQKINVLWVDRPRVYESTHAIRYALAPEPRFEVKYFEPPTDGKGDSLKFYEFERNYDVIIIGDLTARQFSLGDPKIFDKINEHVTKKKSGLLMLGGTETLGNGGWAKHAALADLLPVRLPDKADVLANDVQPVPAKEAADLPFLKFDVHPEKNIKLWKEEFEPLKGVAPLGPLLKDSTKLLEGNGELVMAATRKGDGGHVVVFGADSTYLAWRNSPDAVAGYRTFWRQLVLWLAHQEDRDNRLQVQLDKRRLNANAADVLNFTFSLHGKTGVIADATFKAEIIGPRQKHALTTARDGQQQRGTWQPPKEAGAHRLVVEAKARVDGKEVEAKAEAQFLVALDDIEMLRPIADHETLAKTAAAADGRFHLLDEPALLQYLDDLQGQVNRESRHKTTHWPDWTRVPASTHARDQLAGLWSSFALIGLLLFTALVGGEWLLRRLWGWV